MERLSGERLAISVKPTALPLQRRLRRLWDLLDSRFGGGEADERSAADLSVKVPMLGAAYSLNVGAAGGWPIGAVSNETAGIDETGRLECLVATVISGCKNWAPTGRGSAAGINQLRKGSRVLSFGGPFFFRSTSVAPASRRGPP